MASVKQLLETKFTSFYQISSVPTVNSVWTELASFDLDDTPNVSILSYKEGKVSFNNQIFGNIEVAPYEGFINQCTKPSKFLEGRKKCDYILFHTSTDGYVVLLEITSGFITPQGSTLTKPIINYPGGKLEKSEDQLSRSLQDLLSVPEIEKDFQAKSHKICLMAYELKKHTDPNYFIKHPFERYLTIESAATGEDGAIIPSKTINDLGFEYRRISHEKTFILS